MADTNKKVFQIVINGITESTNAVKSLKEQLQDCEDIIKRLNQAKVEVKVSSGEVTQPKTKVSSGTSSTTTADKTALEIEKEKTKQLELQTEELRNQLVQKEQLKQLNKETLNDIKQEAQGYVEVVDGVKQYANTLNGMSAELKDIKSELRNTDVDSEAFEKLTQKAADLNDKLKSAEEAYGQFGRNVGNYTQSILDALESWSDKDVDFNLAGAEGSLNDLKQQLNELKRYWADLSPDDKNFQKTADAIKSLNNQIQDMEASLKDVGQEANSAFTGRFETTIGGVKASFTNASEACEALRKKLVAMRMAGEQNTPMYQEIIELVRRLSKEVTVANKQIEGMTKTTQSLNKVVGVMKGLSGLASLGQGIAGLFGGQSEELDKLISKFASLTLVTSGISALEEELNKGTSAFAKFANSANDFIDKMGNSFTKIFSGGKFDIEGLNQYIDATKRAKEAQEALQKNGERYAELYDFLEEATKASTSFADAQSEIETVLMSDFATMDDFQAAIEGIKLKYQDLIQEFPQLKQQLEEFQNLQINNNELQQSIDASEDLRNSLDKLSAPTKRVADWFIKLSTTSPKLAAGLKMVATGIKAIGKATVILAALQLLAELIDYLIDGVKSLWETMQGWFGIMSGGEAKKLANDLDTLSKKIDSMNKEIDIEVKLGNMGDVEAQLEKLKNEVEGMKDMKITIDANDKMSEWMTELQDNLDKTDDAWNDLTKTEQEAAEAMQALSKIDPTFFDTLKDKTPKQQLDEITKALQKAGASVDELSSLETILSQDDDAIDKFLDKLSNIDWDLNDIGVDGVKAFGKLGTALQKARQDAASAAQRIANDLKSLTQKEYSLKLSLDATDLESRLEMVKLEMEELASNYGLQLGSNGKVSKKNGGAMNNDEKEVAARIERINQLEIKAAKKANADAVKQKQQQAKQEAESKKREAEQAAKEAKTRARNQANAEIEAMQDGIEKELALLEEKRKEEIEDAKESGKNIVTINQIYDKQVLEVKKKYAKYIEDVRRDTNERIMNAEKEFLSQWKEMQRQMEDTNTNTANTKNENTNTTVTQTITYNTETTGNDGVDAQKGYYQQLLAAQKDYINQKEKLDTEAEQRTIQRLIEDENARYATEAAAYQKELDEYKRSLDEKVESGQITQEDANTELEKLTEQYHKHDEELLQQHNQALQTIMEEGEANLTAIKLNYLQERQSATADELANERSATQDFYNSIDKVMERTQKQNTNKFGFIDYASYRQSLKDALTATEQVATQIEEEKVKLQKALDNNEISFDDFSKAKKELDEFAEEVKQKTADMQTNLSGSFNSWMSGIMDNVNQYTSVLSGMWDTINEMMTRQLDAEQDALDKKQELLDEELEMIEEQLDAQEEITQEHSDKVSDIEDELSSARGDRREALIDQLAQEKKAQEDSIAAENKLTQEKKKNAQKQEQLAKQQDALDKKRKQQEKKAAIVQATINTFTAVSNALAVQPWFVGLALSAVALALGMANVAQISAQQYADGGLLNGKSHKQGGMKIQGTNIEVEGGEMVVNKQSTNANLPLLEYINSNRRTLTRDDLLKFYDNGHTTLINRGVRTKFEEGGQLPQLSVDVNKLMNNATAANDDRPLVVSVVDIINATENVNQVRVLAGDTDND